MLSYVESHTALLKTSIQNYILSHLGKVRHSPFLYLTLTSLKKYLDQQVKASVLEPQPGNWAWEVRYKREKEKDSRKKQGKTVTPSPAFPSAAEMWERGTDSSDDGWQRTEPWQGRTGAEGSTAPKGDSHTSLG